MGVLAPGHATGHGGVAATRCLLSQRLQPLDGAAELVVLRQGVDHPLVGTHTGLQSSLGMVAQTPVAQATALSSGVSKVERRVDTGIDPPCNDHPINQSQKRATGWVSPSMRSARRLVFSRARALTVLVIASHSHILKPCNRI